MVHTRFSEDPPVPMDPKEQHERSLRRAKRLGALSMLVAFLIGGGIGILLYLHEAKDTARDKRLESRMQQVAAEGQRRADAIATQTATGALAKLAADSARADLTTLVRRVAAVSGQVSALEDSLTARGFEVALLREQIVGFAHQVKLLETKLSETGTRTTQADSLRVAQLAELSQRLAVLGRQGESLQHFLDAQERDIKSIRSKIAWTWVPGVIGTGVATSHALGHSGRE